MTTTARRQSNDPSSHTATDAIASAAHGMIDRLAKQAELPEEKLRAATARAESSLQQSLASVRQRRDSAGTLIQQHPVAAIGIALGVGALIARRTLR